ncbi:MAG: hypothetical protein ABSG77_14460 [Candidatus Acidiferrum sp.]
MWASVLDYDASKNSSAFDDQTFGAGAQRLSVNSPVCIFTKDRRAATDNNPSVGDADFNGAEDRVEMDYGLVTLDFSLSEINLELAENRCEFSTPEILRCDTPMGSAEDDVRVHIRGVGRKSPLDTDGQGPYPL